MLYLRSFASVLAVHLATGCGSDGGPPAGGDAAVDAAAAPGCTPTSPRTSTPELLVGPTGLESRYIQLIDAASSSLDLQMYLFTVENIADAVIRAKNRGVAVRVLLDPDHAGNSSIRSQLSSAGVAVRSAPTSFPFSHAKYFVIDQELAVISSGNFNVGAFASERNYAIIDRDALDIEDLLAIFDSDWNGGAAPDLSCTRLVATPVNARSRILELISSAASELDIAALYIADSDVRSTIASARQRGVAVKVLLADPVDFPENYDTATLFRNQDIEVRYARSLELHAKLIIADDVGLVGSQNFSSSGLTQNREVGAMVFETQPFTSLSSSFASDWAAGTP
jgi:phosphatidylserine/phosphatidylglycerophosphate/cardiolipin synthase-like enzyme